MTNKNTLPEAYQHQIQTRTPNEIELTNRISKILSQLNLSRVRSDEATSQPIPDQYFHFVCLSGIPPFDKQFENLELPGDMTVISYSGLKGEYSQKQYREIFKVAGFQYEAEKVRKAILEHSKSKKIIVIYHSFGSFTLMNYLRMFPDHKINGFIDIGGAPIRWYALLSGLVSNFYSLSAQFLLENKEMIHQAYVNDPKLKEAGFIPFKNQYQTIIFLKLPMSKSFETMFESMRNIPSVLKLFLYGSKDRIFPEHLIHQKVVHYSYIKSLDSSYQQKLIQSYKKKHKKQCKNIQEKFVFCIEGGQHSIHMQQKYNRDLKLAISDYCSILISAFEQ